VPRHSAPTAISASAPETTIRSPRRSTNAAAKGPLRPYRIKLIETATEMVAVLQPNSLCNGTIKTPGVERNPAEPRYIQTVRGFGYRFGPV